MTKKLEKYATELAMGRWGRQFEVDNYYYVGNECIALKLVDPIPNMQIESESEIGKGYAKYFSELYDSKKDYKLIELPDMREGIRETVGRKLDRVAYSYNYESPNLDARFVRDMMEALGVKEAYISEKNKPVYLCSSNKLYTICDMGLIMPLYPSDCKEGFWKCTINMIG